jgi:hypothetical protein
MAINGCLVLIKAIDSEIAINSVFTTINKELQLIFLNSNVLALTRDS